VQRAIELATETHAPLLVMTVWDIPYTGLGYAPLPFVFDVRAEMLERAPKVLLVGEAPGFRGMKITGVPFTSRTILEGPANGFGLFGPGKGYVLPPEARDVAAEPTATVMWDVLAELEFLPLLWSACPWHTHVPGRPLSNRTPRASEAALGSPFWQELADMFAVETVVAVGNVAHRSLHRNGVDAPKIRHPAHGGRSGFKRGLAELIAAGDGPLAASARVEGR